MPQEVLTYQDVCLQVGFALILYLHPGSGEQFKLRPRAERSEVLAIRLSAEQHRVKLGVVVEKEELHLYEQTYLIHLTFPMISHVHYEPAERAGCDARSTNDHRS
jgi:hypothetical protein